MFNNSKFIWSVIIFATAATGSFLPYTVVKFNFAADRIIPILTSVGGAVCLSVGTTMIGESAEMLSLHSKDDPGEPYHLASSVAVISFAVMFGIEQFGEYFRDKYLRSNRFNSLLDLDKDDALPPSHSTSQRLEDDVISIPSTLFQFSKDDVALKKDFRNKDSYINYLLKKRIFLSKNEITHLSNPEREIFGTTTHNSQNQDMHALARDTCHACDNDLDTLCADERELCGHKAGLHPPHIELGSSAAFRIGAGMEGEELDIHTCDRFSDLPRNVRRVYGFKLDNDDASTEILDSYLYPSLTKSSLPSKDTSPPSFNSDTDTVYLHTAQSTSALPDISNFHKSESSDLSHTTLNVEACVIQCPNDNAPCPNHLTICPNNRPPDHRNHSASVCHINPDTETLTTDPQFTEAFDTCPKDVPCLSKEDSNLTLPREAVSSQARRGDMLVSAILYTLFSIHSILEGIGLGSSAEHEYSIAFGILLHKGLAAFAVGSSLLECKMSNPSFYISVILFALTTPLGVFIGTVALTNGALHSGYFIGAAAGAFLFIATCELIPKSFKRKEDRLYKASALVLAAAAMTLISSH